MELIENKFASIEDPFGIDKFYYLKLIILKRKFLIIKIKSLLFGGKIKKIVTTLAKKREEEDS